ncbi:MAG TPA: hypothetical protein GXX29_05480 [Firmicutes bacterium]|nr:hypothetical protein [Bacillota bacterium]
MHIILKDAQNQTINCSLKCIPSTFLALYLVLFILESATIDRIVAKSTAYGYVVGYHHDDVKLAKEAREHGCTVISVGNDSFFLEKGAKSALQEM